MGKVCNIKNCGNLRGAIDELAKSMLLSDDNFVKEEFYRIQKKYGL